MALDFSGKQYPDALILQAIRFYSVLSAQLPGYRGDIQGTRAGDGSRNVPPLGAGVRTPAGAGVQAKEIDSSFCNKETDLTKFNDQLV